MMMMMMMMMIAKIVTMILVDDSDDDHDDGSNCSFNVFGVEYNKRKLLDANWLLSRAIVNFIR